MGIRILNLGIILLLVSTISFGQSRREIRKQVDAFKNKKLAVRQFNAFSVADSLKNNLISSGIDTVLLYYKTIIYKTPIHKDGTDDHHVAVLVYKDSSQMIVQKVNDFAIYEPQKTSRQWVDLYYLFQYYLTYNAEIHDEFFQPYKGSRYYNLGDDLEALSKAHEQLTIIDLIAGNNSSKWVFPDI